jgi:hypothetical protein
MLRRLQMVTDIALQQLTLGELMPALLSRLRDALNADAAAILLVPRTESISHRPARSGSMRSCEEEPR